MMQSNGLHKILFVGGGTGGHFYPLIAIAEALNATQEPPELYYSGPDQYDAGALQVEQIHFIRIGAGKRRRYTSLLNFIDLFRTFFGVFVAIIELYRLYPDVVMSKGGYTSVPVVIAAAFLRIPVVVHESDAVMGKANKVGSKFAQYIITTYDEVRTPNTKASVLKLGIPIRKNLLNPPSQNAISALGIDPDRPVILIIGGSQGAERVNALILDSLDELLADYTIIHQTGKQNFTACKDTADHLIPDTERRKHYHPLPFLAGETLNDAYHLAQVVISRAGSNSIYEIALHGKPAILIPIPEEISHDQRTNAYSYARTDGAIVLEEENLKDGLLRAEIDRIMQNDALYTTMATGARSFGRTDSAQQVATLLMQIAHEHTN